MMAGIIPQRNKYQLNRRHISKLKFGQAIKILILCLILLWLLLVPASVKSEINISKNLYFDIKSFELLKLKKSEPIQIIPGESNYDKTIREAEEKKQRELNRQRKLMLMPQWKWDIVEIIKKYNWDWKIASAIFYGESGLTPDAYNHIGACGVVQLYRCPNINWSDPAVNIDYAYHHKYLPALRNRGNGWLPWEIYTKGTYRRYLYMFD